MMARTRERITAITIEATDTGEGGGLVDVAEARDAVDLLSLLAFIIPTHKHKQTPTPKNAKIDPRTDPQFDPAV